MSIKKKTTITKTLSPVAALALALALVFAGCENPASPAPEPPVEGPLNLDPGVDPWSIVEEWHEFDSLADMSAFLAAAPVNRVFNPPYGIRLSDQVDVADFAAGAGTSFDALGNLFAAFNNRYVALDLSACTGTRIEDTLNLLRGTEVSRLVLLVLPEGL